MRGGRGRGGAANGREGDGSGDEAGYGRGRGRDGSAVRELAAIRMGVKMLLVVLPEEGMANRGQECAIGILAAILGVEAAAARVMGWSHCRHQR